MSFYFFFIYIAFRGLIESFSKIKSDKKNKYFKKVENISIFFMLVGVKSNN